VLILSYSYVFKISLSGGVYENVEVEVCSLPGGVLAGLLDG
jgi:hypothetical protein